MIYRLLLCLTLLLVSCGSANMNYDNDVLSFTYPVTYKSVSIQDAPHMLLKLESERKNFSISCWDYGYDEDVSIWDDFFYKRYKAMQTEDRRIVDVSKGEVNIKNGSIRCLRAITEHKEIVNGQVAQVKTLQVLLIYEGRLFICQLTNEIDVSDNKLIKESDDLMVKLELKSCLPSQQELNDYLKKIVDELNTQCPIKWDECSSLKRAIFIDTTVTFYVEVDGRCEKLLDVAEFKRRLAQNLSLALEKSFVKYMDQNNYTFAYLVYNKNGELIHKISVTSGDVLNYY